MPNYTYKGDWSKLKQLLKFTVKDDDIVVNEFQVRLTNVPEELSLDEDKLVVKYLDGTNKYVSLDKYASKSDLQYQTARLENDLRLATSAIDASTKQALEDYRTEFLLSDELLDIVSDYADSAAEEANEALNLRLQIEENYQQELCDAIKSAKLELEDKIDKVAKMDTGMHYFTIGNKVITNGDPICAYDLSEATKNFPEALVNKDIDGAANRLYNIGVSSFNKSVADTYATKEDLKHSHEPNIAFPAANKIQLKIDDQRSVTQLPIFYNQITQDGAKITFLNNYGEGVTTDFSFLDKDELDGKTIDGHNNYICNLDLVEASAPTLVEDGCVLTSVEGYPDWVKPEQVITYDEDHVYANFNGKTKRLQFANDEVTYEGSSRELYEHYIYLRNGKTGKLLQLVIRNAGSEQFTTLTLAKWLHWLGFHGPMYFYPANGVVETKQYWAATMRKIGTELDVDTYAYGVYSGDGETIKACAGSELGVDLSDFALEDKVRKVM